MCPHRLKCVVKRGYHDGDTQFRTVDSRKTKIACILRRFVSIQVSSGPQRACGGEGGREGVGWGNLPNLLKLTSLIRHCGSTEVGDVWSVFVDVHCPL